MQPQLIMREANLSQSARISRYTASQHTYNAPIKEVHNERKYAKTDLEPFLTISKQPSGYKAKSSAAFRPSILSLSSSGIAERVLIELTGSGSPMSKG